MFSTASRFPEIYDGRKTVPRSRSRIPSVPRKSEVSRNQRTPGTPQSKLKTKPPAQRPARSSSVATRNRNEIQAPTGAPALPHRPRTQQKKIGQRTHAASDSRNISSPKHIQRTNPSLQQNHNNRENGFSNTSQFDWSRYRNKSSYGTNFESAPPKSTVVSRCWGRKSHFGTPPGSMFPEYSCWSNQRKDMSATFSTRFHYVTGSGEDSVDSEEREVADDLAQSQLLKFSKPREQLELQNKIAAGEFPSAKQSEYSPARGGPGDLGASTLSFATAKEDEEPSNGFELPVTRGTLVTPESFLDALDEATPALPPGTLSRYGMKQTPVEHLARATLQGIRDVPEPPSGYGGTPIRNKGGFWPSASTPQTTSRAPPMASPHRTKMPPLASRAAPLPSPRTAGRVAPLPSPHRSRMPRLVSPHTTGRMPQVERNSSPRISTTSRIQSAREETARQHRINSTPRNMWRSSGSFGTQQSPLLPRSTGRGHDNRETPVRRKSFLQAYGLSKPHRPRPAS